MLTNIERYKVVNEYIGVSEDGYLGNFSYRTHQEFYPKYCNLDIDPLEIQGSTRRRFIKILKKESPINQAKILRGVLKKFPVEFFPEEQRKKKKELYEEITKIIKRLEGGTPISPPILTITSEVVERAINDAKMLIERRGATSGVDRIHTALHGYLKAICSKENIEIEENSTLTAIFKRLIKEHPSFQTKGARQKDIEKILKSISNILDALNPLRNIASVAHPNIDLLEEDEAMLVINSAQTILNYLNSKLK